MSGLTEGYVARRRYDKSDSFGYSIFGLLKKCASAWPV